MLTAEGMRQQYLLGRYNRKRYTETFKLLSEEYEPSEIYIQSTNVNRTMQSGYSELMGLYPPSRPVPMTAAQMKAVSSEGVSQPPFGIKDLDRVN